MVQNTFQLLIDEIVESNPEEFEDIQQNGALPHFYPPFGDYLNRQNAYFF